MSLTRPISTQRPATNLAPQSSPLSPPSSSPSLSFSTSTSASSESSSASLVDLVRGMGIDEGIRVGSDDGLDVGGELSREGQGEANFKRHRPSFLTRSAEQTASPNTPNSQTVSENESPFHRYSPTGSVASTAKDGITPRAEIPQPIWPLSTVKTDKRLAARRLDTEVPPSETPRGTEAEVKGASEESSPTLPTFSPLSALEPTPVTTEPSTMRYASGGQVPTKKSPSPRPQPGSHILAASTKTGCYISEPISAPEHYPLPMSASTSSSSSIHSSVTSNSSAMATTPPPPRWAMPPAHTNKISGRAKSFGDAMMERPDVDFDPELFQVPESEGDDEIEVIKGSGGRIALRSTRTVYEIMVWLPGFSLENITIATRGRGNINIVADRWEEGDHAQWDVKLGDDANMRAIGAKFGGHDLKVTIPREQRHHSSSSRLGQSRSGQKPKLSISTPATPNGEASEKLADPPADFWANQWSPHAMTRRLPAKKTSLKTI
ncbi:uncharacterized protein MKK02DRAFT_37591 [Dioszegia hungarica]|uniref:SHSP domain-containing protein n=1 Tax=Dioszegia hungarica TaxID=4972 RepID=A0AA38H573_9TREE|nr:uncharacterized protein MKK02DRAFT_37591 [Dioszegia hungarica]KAI9634712.1 hypothetical protein MKK02DRAFT_37591 [Dioszegia hungarica]